MESNCKFELEGNQFEQVGKSFEFRFLNKIKVWLDGESSSWANNLCLQTKIFSKTQCNKTR